MNTTDVTCTRCAEPVAVPTVLARALSATMTCTRCATPDTSDVDPVPTRADLWRRNRVPNDCRAATIDGIRADGLRRLLLQFTRQWPDPLVTQSGAQVRAYPFGGPAGVGKSCAVWAALTELVDTGQVSPRDIVSGTEEELLVPASRVTAYGNGRDRSSTWRQLIPHHTRIVFVDDVGYGAYADDSARVAATKALLDRVGQLGAVLFLTTNIPAKDFSALLGPAAASRLSAMSTLSPQRAFYFAGTLDQRTDLDWAATA